VAPLGLHGLAALLADLLVERVAPLGLDRLAALLAFITPFAVAAELFDGRTLAGWEGDLKWWTVRDGAITGGSTTEKIPRNFFLATERSFQNFDLRLKLKLTGDPKFLDGIRSVSVGLGRFFEELYPAEVDAARDRKAREDARQQEAKAARQAAQDRLAPTVRNR
jgi:hypothetical protein